MFKVEIKQLKLRLRGRFNAGERRSHYVVIPIALEDDWLFYKELVCHDSSVTNRMVVLRFHVYFAYLLDSVVEPCVAVWWACVAGVCDF